MWIPSVFPILIMALAGGCGTMATGSGPTQTVRFDSYPQGADVVVDGNNVGKTPTSANLIRTADHTAEFNLAGYPSHVVVLKHGPNSSVLGNFLFPGPPGFLVDGLSGASKGALTPNGVDVNMEPTQGEPAQPAASSTNDSDSPPLQ
jgi:hypothetical protein